MTINRLTTALQIATQGHSIGNPVYEDLQHFMRIEFAKRTVLLDAPRYRFMLRAVSAEDQRQLGELLSPLQTKFKAALEWDVLHPVTGTKDGVLVTFPNELNFSTISGLVMQAGCFFPPNDKDRNRHRQAPEPRILPADHNCVRAPKPPHPLSQLGLIFYDQGQFIFEEGVPRDRVAPHLPGATVLENQEHPITNMPRSVAAASVRHDAAEALQDLPHCFTRHGLQDWINRDHQTLQTYALAQLAKVAKIAEESPTFLKLRIPLAEMKPLVMYYLKEVVFPRGIAQTIGVYHADYKPDPRSPHLQDLVLSGGVEFKDSFARQFGPDLSGSVHAATPVFGAAPGRN